MRRKANLNLKHNKNQKMKDTYQISDKMKINVKNLFNKEHICPDHARKLKEPFSPDKIVMRKDNK